MLTLQISKRRSQLTQQLFVMSRHSNRGNTQEIQMTLWHRVFIFKCGQDDLLANVEVNNVEAVIKHTIFYLQRIFTASFTDI